MNQFKLGCWKFFLKIFQKYFYKIWYVLANNKRKSHCFECKYLSFNFETILFLIFISSTYSENYQQLSWQTANPNNIFEFSSIKMNVLYENDKEKSVYNWNSNFPSIIKLWPKEKKISENHFLYTINEQGRHLIIST